MRVLGMTLVCATACTNVVTAEQQGYAPPYSAKGGREVAAQDAAEKAERLSTELSDDLHPAVNAKGTLLLYQSETYEVADGARRLAAQVLLGVDPNNPTGAVVFSTKSRFANGPSFLPDGSSFVFVTNALGPLALVKTETTKPNAALKVIVSSDMAPEAGEPAVSPDGARVAFSLKPSAGGRAVAVINIDGTKLNVLGEGRSPTWSTGTELVFVRTDAQGFNHLYAASVESFSDVRKITTGDFDCDHPSFSPDGKRLVFASNRGWQQAQRQRSDYLQLVSADADGRGLTQLTSETRRNGTPFWARDGFIYFTSDRAGSLDLYRMRAP